MAILRQPINEQATTREDYTPIPLGTIVGVEVSETEPTNPLTEIWIKPSNKIGFDNYSTEEQIIGSWIDGKPLYRKVLSVTTHNSTGYKQIAHGVQNVGMIMISNGYIECDDAIIGQINAFGNETYTAWVGVNSTYIMFNNTGYKSQNKPCKIILEYTKTTD